MKQSKYYYDFDRNMSQEQIKNKPLRYFDFSEFDSPDEKGSGEKHMDRGFLRKLDNARHIAGIPFRITSGFRTKAYNIDLTNRGYKTSKTSPHMKGLAADISTPDSKTRYKVIEALRLQNFTRIGIGKNFVHCDTDTSKSQEVIWHYY
jgi:zinc D-Ala-D-Ala carboxypeptidase